MKIHTIININKFILFFILTSFSSFSQKKDVYFLLNETHKEYILFTSPGKISVHGKYSKFKNINLTNRKEYMRHQKKVKEAKKNGTYSYSPECGCDNLKMPVSSLEFSVISRKKIKLSHYDLHKLNLVDYKWIKENSWKPINRKYYKVNFKDLYFLYKISENKYVSFKVGITLSAH